MAFAPLPGRADGRQAMAQATCTGVILAGGRAARYAGEPKGALRVGGRRIVDRVASALQQVTEETVILGAPDSVLELPARTRLLRDDEAYGGPLAALATALHALGTSVLLVAWDMPFLSPSLLGELRRIGERTGADAVAPESGADGRVEPLCAWYAPAAADAAAALLARGERSLRALLDAVAAERLPLARVLDFGRPDRIFHNVNAPADLAAAERMALGLPDAAG